MKIVALSGKMHSGKSYVALALGEYGYVRYSFAGALKRDIEDMGFSIADVMNKPPWMRELMQKYGQARRAVDPDYWVDRLMKFIESVREQEDPLEEALIVIDDMRFENEADALLNYAEEHDDVDLQLIRLERDDYDRSKIPGSDEVSETALDEYPEFDCTYIIESGHLDGLREAAQEILWRFRRGRTASTSPERAAE